MGKAKRDDKGRWQKGQSGNPDGSTSEEQAARVALMRGLAGHVPQALERIGQLLQSADERVALGAVKVVIESVRGKDRADADLPAMPTAIIIDGYEIRPREKPSPTEART